MGAAPAAPAAPTTRRSRVVVVVACGLCLFGSALLLAASLAGEGGATADALFGPWNPMTAHVARPQMSMRTSKAMFSLWQQARWARHFQGQPAPPVQSAIMNPARGVRDQRSVADAIGFKTALAAGAPHGTVRYPRDISAARASELEQEREHAATPHYVRELELAAHPARHRQARGVGAAAARTQALNYIESEPRSDYRHPGDMNVYQTYEYFPRPEGKHLTDYDGSRLWSEMQRDYRAQHPSASTYPAVPVVFEESSEGGHPVANPLSQPVEDIYQGMGYEAHMQPPYGMGMSPEPGVAHRQSQHSTMQLNRLSAQEGFEVMKRREEEGVSGHSYRNPDWREHYVPRVSADHRSLMATPSVASPVYMRGSSAGGHYAQPGARRDEHDTLPMIMDPRAEQRALQREKAALTQKQRALSRQQQTIDRELSEEKEKAARVRAGETPAQISLYRWERKHGVDDPKAYEDVAGGASAEDKARAKANLTEKKAGVQQLKANGDQGADLPEQQLTSEVPETPGGDVEQEVGADAAHEHAMNEEIETLKETLHRMASEEERQDTKMQQLRSEMQKLQRVQARHMQSFDGRLQDDRQLHQHMREIRSRERAEQHHKLQLEQKVALLHKEEEKKKEDETRAEHQALESRIMKQEASADQTSVPPVATLGTATGSKETQLAGLLTKKQESSASSTSTTDHHQLTRTQLQATMRENARLNAQLRLATKMQSQLDVAQGGTKLSPDKQPSVAAHDQSLTTGNGRRRASSPTVASKGSSTASSESSKGNSGILGDHKDGEAMSIPRLVMRKAEQMVKHKAQTALAQKFESQIDADTNFIFSGQVSDETPNERAADEIESRELSSSAGQGVKTAAKPKHGFGELHQMEKEVLTQLIQANKQHAKAEALKMAEAKKAAAERLAVRKEQLKKEQEAVAEEEAQKLADKRAEAAKLDAEKAAHAAQVAREHKPVGKMTVRQRALAFVRAFDDSVESDGSSLSAGSSPQSISSLASLDRQQGPHL